jgi:hypothetical protein
MVGLSPMSFPRIRPIKSNLAIYACSLQQRTFWLELLKTLKWKCSAKMSTELGSAIQNASTIRNIRKSFK